MGDTPGTRRRSSLGRVFDALASRPMRQPRLSIDMSPLETDLLVSYQLSLDKPSVLGSEAFHVAKVVDGKNTSLRVHEALLSAGILIDKEQGGDQLNVDTSKITRHFANQIPFCSAHILRRIISLLFIFEEQAMRWHTLDQEERELHQLLANPPHGMGEELQLRLEAVARKRRLLPSQQDREGLRSDDDLPVYSRD